ncbi:hypothetical protein QQF64_031647 [Cirrhinus molitorella]|uniref:Uncharacterized protein n=1 Tax=Cirrhinus molitorella TaxID=172907 RepID=A0ABR3MXI4_9TELE
MDPAEDSSIRAVVELQGAMLGRQAEELSHARHAMDALLSQVTELSDQLRHLQAIDCNTTQAVPQQSTSHEPRINNPQICVQKGGFSTTIRFVLRQKISC